MDTEKYRLTRLPPIGSKKAEDLSPRHTNKYKGLTGPSYSLDGNQTYILPPPRVLKPFSDTSAGGLDTWPAHATSYNQGISTLALTATKHLVLVGNESTGKAQHIPKPRFLEQLENFLQKELIALGVDTVGPSELRLQAYREVFEYLIEDFKTYKSLLAAIKNEYEMMISYQRDQIRELEPLKQMIVTVSEQCDQKIMDLRHNEKQEMLNLKEENRNLYKQIDSMRQEQASLETQVERLKDELSQQYKNFRDECDARKLLISDMNDLRNQQEDTLMTQQAMAEDGEKDDPITLRIALKRARQDEKEATRRLHEMEANYGDVIPRRDFEQLEKKHIELNEKLGQSESDFHHLKSEHEQLLEEYKIILQQRNDFHIELTRLRENTTPRPQWNRCSEYVAGGSMRWKELSEGKSSNQLVQVLLNEIAGIVPDGSGGEFFEPKGTGPDVPKYLQCDSKVRNRRLNKRDTALLVRDIWREKAIHDAERPAGGRESMADFLHMYLQRRFGLEKMILEWGYNLHDSCERYAHDEMIGMMWKVLNHSMDEELYHQIQLQMHRLLNHVTKADVDSGSAGDFDRDGFKATLASFLNKKEDESIQMLLNAAEVDLNIKDTDRIDYKSLFMEDDEGHTGPFLEEFRNQMRSIMKTQADLVKTELGTTSPVTHEELTRAISKISPHMDKENLFRIVCYAYAVHEPEKLSEVEALELNVIIVRLANAYFPMFKN